MQLGEIFDAEVVVDHNDLDLGDVLQRSREVTRVCS